MSVLSLPRLYFQGYLSWDPNITNNLPDLWDPVNVAAVLPGDAPQNVPYRQFVIDNATVLGDWNIYGSHACNFVQYKQFTSTITGGATSSGTVTVDPVIGQPLSMAGRLVDLDPRGADTSQYFFDQFSVGSSDAPFLSAPCAQRMHSRWLNFSRNLNTSGDPRIQIAGIAAVVWQTTFPTASLQLDSAASPNLLGAFAKGLQQADVQGIMVRFVTYRTLYFQNGIFNDIAQTPQTMAQLQALYQQGLMFANPAYSVVTGSIGLWMENEVPSVPGGRYLVPNEGQTSPTGLGPVVAEFDSYTNMLSLDFGSAIPETDFDLDKQSFGTLTVSAGGTEVATIDVDQYDSAAYQATGGIIDVHIDDTDAMSGLITITGTLNGSPITMYTESEFSAQTDTKNIYLDQNDTVPVTVYVAEKGKPAAPGTLVQVAHYPATEANPVVMSPPLIVGENGLATFSIEATQQSSLSMPSTSGPGYSYYRFTPYRPGTTPPLPPLNIDPMNDFYCGARTLPFDDELNATTPDSALTWAFVYANILQPFNLCPAAAMDAIGIPLDSQATWDNPKGAAMIQAATAASNFNSTSYMPITRELSNGMRNLLDRWANLVISGTRPVTAGVSLATEIQPARLRKPRLIREAR